MADQNISDQLTTITSAGNMVPLYQLNPVDGDLRVPPAEFVQLLGSNQTSGVTAVALGWQKPSNNLIDRFEIWIQRTAYSSQNPFMAVAVTDSPASFSVTSDQNTVCIATIVTVLKNGLRTDFKSSPTVTFNVSVVTATSVSSLNLNANGKTVSIDSNAFNATHIESIEVKDNVSANAALIYDALIALFKTDPNNNIRVVSIENAGNVGIIRLTTGSGSGHIDGQGSTIVLDATSGNISFEGMLRTSASLASTATAGAATLPSNPIGFLNMIYNGVLAGKIAIYNN